jgi:hypothetical protein
VGEGARTPAALFGLVESGFEKMIWIKLQIFECNVPRKVLACRKIEIT